jgi:type VII secretion effector (TIGR04197 family)
MSQSIASSVQAAAVKANSLRERLDAFSHMPTLKLTAINQTTPARDHDACAELVKSSLQSYCESLLRDANDLEKIAASFDEADRRIASELWVSNHA